MFPSSYLRLFLFASSTSNYEVSNGWVNKENELERCEEERSVPSLRLLSANCLTVLKITTKILARGSRYRIRD